MKIMSTLLTYKIYINALFTDFISKKSNIYQYLLTYKIDFSIFVSGSDERE